MTCDSEILISSYEHHMKDEPAGPSVTGATPLKMRAEYDGKKKVRIYDGRIASFGAAAAKTNRGVLQADTAQSTAS